MAASDGQPDNLAFLLEHLDAGSVSEVVAAMDRLHAPHINLTDRAFFVRSYRIDFPTPDEDHLINVNMMPFDILNVKDTLPKELHGYLPLIRSLPVEYVTTLRNDQGVRAVDRRPSGSWASHVAYLTVHESWMVPGGGAQRRPGLHVERPGSVVQGGRLVCADADRIARYRRSEITSKDLDEDSDAYMQISWGHGYYDESFKVPVEGIWICSNVAGTSGVYPALLERPEEVTDADGGIGAHLRDSLDRACEGKGEGKRKLLGAGEMCWITDRTPHESLPLPPDVAGELPVLRQFFRVVVGRISHWRADRNTPNPLGTQPDAIIV